MVELPCLLSSAEMSEGTTWQAGLVHLDELRALLGEIFRDELLDRHRQ